MLLAIGLAGGYEKTLHNVGLDKAVAIVARKVVIAGIVISQPLTLVRRMDL